MTWPGAPRWEADNLLSYGTAMRTVCHRCWASLVESFSGMSTALLIAIFHSLRFEIPPTWRAKPPYLYPLGTRWPSYSSRRATMKVLEPTSKRENYV
jgi:hypothetical protein